jgi:hypothetical protein
MHGEVAMKEPLRFSGVMPANVLPFVGSRDRRAGVSPSSALARRHPRGHGIVANGHASEVSSLNREG